MPVVFASGGLYAAISSPMIIAHAGMIAAGKTCRHLINAPDIVRYFADAMVFLMQAGFCMFESGLVRSKNSINVAVKNLLDSSVSMIVFGLIGFGLAFGDSVQGWFGRPFPFWNDANLTAYFIFQVVFCGTAATIVSGAIAERAKLSVYMILVLLISGLVYQLVAHWCWGGSLQHTSKGCWRPWE